MHFSQHRMALASLVVAVIAVLFVSGTTVRAGTPPVQSPATRQPMVAILDTIPATSVRAEANHTIMGPMVPEPTSTPEVAATAVPTPVSIPVAADAEPTMQAASLGGPTNISRGSPFATAKSPPPRRSRSMRAKAISSSSSTRRAK